MTALVVALLLASQPGLLPRKPPSADPGASKGPAITPGQVPDGPAVPPVILDDERPHSPAPAQPQPAPRAAQPAPAPAPSQPEAQRAAPSPPPATAAPAPAQPAAPSEAGQWVYTRQHGWIWMAYRDAYTYVPPSGRGRPYAYVYRSDRGWSWVAAPWVWGIGPWPDFGARGPWRFGWYRAGHWRTPWRWRYWPARSEQLPSW